MPAARADRCSASSRLRPGEGPRANPPLDSPAAFCTWVTRLARSSTSQSRWLSVIVVRCSGCSVACMLVGYPPPAGRQGWGGVLGGGGGRGGGGACGEAAGSPAVLGQADPPALPEGRHHAARFLRRTGTRHRG